MNTDKPGAPYYQRSVEGLASVQSSPEGISGTEAATRLVAVWRKRPAAEAG